MNKRCVLVALVAVVAWMGVASAESQAAMITTVNAEIKFLEQITLANKMYYRGNGRPDYEFFLPLSAESIGQVFTHDDPYYAGPWPLESLSFEILSPNGYRGSLRIPRMPVSLGQTLVSYDQGSGDRASASALITNHAPPASYDSAEFILDHFERAPLEDWLTLTTVRFTVRLLGEVVAVPEPTSILLLVLGAGMLAARPRSSSRR